LLGFPKLLQHPLDRLRIVRDYPHAAHLTAHLGYRDRNGLRMDIKAHKSYGFHRPAPVRMRLCAAVRTRSKA